MTHDTIELAISTLTGRIMNLQVNLPADLEAIIKKRAEQAGVDLPTYILLTLRASGEDASNPKPVSDEQFAASLHRLAAIHANANPNFDDSRESIYAGRGE